MSTAADFRRWLAQLRTTHPAEAAQLADGPVYLGVSGGADSLALAYTAVGIAKTDLPGADFRALIVDHQLQAGSDEVAATAAATCEHLGVPARVLTIDVPGGENADEAAARIARYRALGKAAAGRPLLVAHTASDDAEGVLLGLARGSGTGALAGLRPITTGNRTTAEHPAGEHPATEHLAIAAGAAWLGRPLLASTRASTEATCRRAGLSFWSDPHNSSPRFRRSRVRTELLPLLEDILGTGVQDALTRTARLLREDAEFLDATARAEYDQRIRQPKRVASYREGRSTDGTATEGTALNDTELDCAELANLPAAIRKRVIKQWLAGKTGPLTYSHLTRIDALVTDWTGQGGVSVPWHTMNGYEALGTSHAPHPGPQPAGLPPTGRPARLVVTRRGGSLCLVAEDQPTHTKDRRAHD